MIDQLFTDPVLSKPATYLAFGTTTPYPVRVIPKQPDTVVGFGEAQLHVSTTLFDIRCLDIPEPSTGDQIVFEGQTYVIQSEPIADRERLVWTLNVRPA